MQNWLYRDPPADFRRLLSRSQEVQYAAPGPFNQARPNADPNLQTALSLLSFNNTGRFVLGKIDDSTAIAGVYRVVFEKFRQPQAAVAGMQTSGILTGAKQLNSYVPGTWVVCLDHPELRNPVILCALPQINIAADRAQLQILSGTSRQRADNAHKLPMRTQRSGYIPDASAKRLIDATTVGEAGWITELGTRIFIDPFFTMFGLSEACSLTTFIYDQLVRLAAYNFQHMTAGMEREGLNDEGEYNDWTGYTPYPWEQMGRYTPGNPLREYGALEWQKDSPSYFKLEPALDAQQPWHRERVFRGYLGNLFKHIFQAPPQDTSDDALAVYGGTQPVYPGLIDITASMHGYYSVRAARGISLCKTVAISSPARREKPEQPTSGDTPDNYRAAGVSGQGPEHRVTGGPRSNSNYPELQRALGVMDLHAYIFNYQGLHPFVYHENDYDLPEESELNYVGGVTCEVFDFGELAQTAYLSASRARRQIKIDHRYGTQDVYRTQSAVDLLDDGGVVQYDGFGSQILMTAGSMWFSAPGDIWFRAGRNVVTFAGGDNIVRAKKNIDMSTTQGQISASAATDLMLMSGHSGSGGTLIENKASGFIHATSAVLTDRPPFVGITMKSANSDVAIMSPKLYLRSLGSGTIYLDAGNGTVTTTAAQSLNYLPSGMTINFGTDDSKHATVFSAGFSIIGSGLGVAGSFTATDFGIFRRGVYISGGTIITEGAKASDKVLVLDGIGLAQVNDSISLIQQESTKVQPKAYNDIYRNFIKPATRDVGMPGNPDVIDATAFSYRTEDQYQTHDLYIPEDRWQQLGRLDGQSLPTWQERPVAYRGTPTYPYPGKDFYVGARFIQQDLELFDATQGRNRDRGSGDNVSAKYRDPRFADTRFVSLNQYQVTRP